MNQEILNLKLPLLEIEAFCKKWAILEFALFGSILTDRFKSNTSDVDVLVTFDPANSYSLFDLGSMQADLEDLFGRKVDLVERPVIEKSLNPIRKNSILSSAKVIYAAA